MITTAETRSTFEFTINAGSGMRVHVDSYAGGAPYLIIGDGSTEVTIRPPDDEITPSAIAFADDLVEKTRAYAAELRART